MDPAGSSASEKGTWNIVQHVAVPQVTEMIVGSQRTLLFLVCGKENGKGHDLGSERVPCFCWGFFLFFLLFSLQSPGSTEVEA